MGISIGRIGTVALPLAGPASWQERPGGTVALSGQIKGVDQAHAVHLWHQLRGLTPAHEPFVVVRSTGHPHRDGWYQLVSQPSVTPPAGVKGGIGPIEWAVELRKVDASTPRYEMHLAGATYPNDHSLVSTASWVGVPSAAQAFDGGGTRYTRPVAEGGTVAALVRSQVYYDAVLSMIVSNLAEVYRGSARVEVDITGAGDWHPAIGAELPAVPPERVRVSNGVVRCGWDPARSGWAFEAWLGGAWRNIGQSGATPNVWQITPETDVYLTTTPVSVSVVANTPSCATVRYLISYSSTHRVLVDFTVRRWGRGVVCMLKSSQPMYWGMHPTAISGSETLTGSGASYSMPADANGHTPMIHVPKTYAVNDGRFRVTAATTQSVPFGLSVVEAGAGSVNVASTIELQYYAQAWPLERVSLP